MTTYYRSPDVLITDRVFAVAAPRPVRYRIDDLEAPHVVRGELHPARVATGRIALGTAVAAVVVLPLLDSPAAWVVALLAAAVPTVATGACIRIAPRTYELRATYRAYEVCLFASADGLRFGQVQRALVRAIEARRGRLEDRGWMVPQLER